MRGMFTMAIAVLSMFFIFVLVMGAGFKFFASSQALIGESLIDDSLMKIFAKYSAFAITFLFIAGGLLFAFVSVKMLGKDRDY